MTNIPHAGAEIAVLHYLSRRDAGAYLKASYGLGCYRTLAQLASDGGGPAFHKAGRRALYTIADLDAWAVAKIGPRRASTARREA
jgi:hypothetical protein